jgi:iron complex outermembrane receptor protein
MAVHRLDCLIPGGDADKNDVTSSCLIAALLQAILAFAVPLPATAESPKEDLLVGLSMEELLDVEVYSASKFAQKSTAAPASVTVITAADIRDYGYRTLADLLRSVRGLNISYDRNYSYLGIRGFGRTGDYNGRVLLLVDGHRLNDPVYDTAAIGTELALDLDLIDKVEIVRGPGSSIYGSNAVFGIVNIITKSGGDLSGVEAAAAIASYGTDQERLSWGAEQENGIEILLSATRYRSDGQDLFFPEFGATAHNLDFDRYDSLFGKLDYAGVTLSGAWANRTKGFPTAAYSTLFDNPDAESLDGYGYVNLGYRGDVGERWELNAHLSYGRYVFEGIYPYIYTAGDPVTLNKDDVRASWWGAEARLVGQLRGHRLVAGAEYQENRQLDQANFDIAPYELYLDDKRSSTRSGLYLQDEATLKPGLLLNAGVRYDYYTTFGSTLNPRLALIWSPRSATTIKGLYGTAFRAPNSYELYYEVDPQKANPDLEPEEVTSYEVVIEHYYRSDLRLTASAYYNRIDQLIDQVLDPADDMLVFVNQGAARAHGLEFEVERLWRQGKRLRASYAWQQAEDAATGERLVNSPEHLAKLNFAAPLADNGWLGGLELQYTGSRKTLAGDTAGAYLLTNLTLVNDSMTKGLQLSASVYNLFNGHYADPGGAELIHDSGVTLDTVSGDGRNYRLKASYRF